MNHHPQSELKVWQPLRDKDCHACSLHKSAETVCLLGDGPVPADMMIIGESPGSIEDQNGIPFSGESGLFLRRSLKEVGLDPRQIFISYAVACHPTGNRAPTSKELKTCGNLFLLKQIEQVKPKSILVLGNVALQFLKGKKTAVTKLEGSTFEWPPRAESDIQFLLFDKRVTTATCIPSRHPSSILRLKEESPKEFEYLAGKFRESLRLFKNAVNPQEDKLKFHRTLDLPARFDEEKPVYVDIETDGLNPFRDDSKIHCQGLTQGDETLTSAKIEDSHFPLMRKLLSKYKIICHRNLFEGSWYRWKYGITPAYYYDTKLGAHLRDENIETGLKYQAIKHLKVEPWSEEQDWKDPNFKKLLPYNARDNQYGYRLYQTVDLPFLKKNPKTAKLVKYILMPAMEVFTEIACNGFHIDPDKAKVKLKTVRNKKTVLNKELNRIAGKEINPGSPPQVARLFYTQLRLTCPVYTKGGKSGVPKPSTSEAALIRLRGQHKATDILWEWRGWAKYESTYLEPWIRQGPDLHALYDFTGTDTGRLSSSMVKNKRGEKKTGGVIHQCPRDGFIRNLVSPRGYVPVFDKETRRWGIASGKVALPDDWCMVAADLSQVELRLVAHAANEPTMIEIFQNPSNTPEGDIHFQTARTLQPTGEIIKETRKKAKAVNFGFVYGMMWKKFMAYALEKFDLKLSPKESKEYRWKFFNKYSGLKSWHSRVEAFVKQNGYMDSVLGRRRHLPDACLVQGLVCGMCNGAGTKNCWGCDGSGWCVEPGGDEMNEWVIMEAVRQAINSPIQGDGSNLLLFIIALIASYSLPWEFKINRELCFAVGSAHDSMLFECHKKYAREMRDGINYTIKNLPRLLMKFFGVEFRVPILMDVNVYKTCWEGDELELRA